jgi:hypothetical protein
MNTHDVLAFAVGTEAVRRVRAGLGPWNTIFSADSYVTASRVWPVPDFVLVDTTNNLTIGAEFKPPQQSKREYLTGLGQAVAYSRDFDYGLLILPTFADDGYPIADHVQSVLLETPFENAPVGLLSYDPTILSSSNPGFKEVHFFERRIGSPSHPASHDQSFYAKWREMGPEEIFAYLSCSYDEIRHPSSSTGTIRDIAFNKLWKEIQAGKLHHWGGGVRHYTDTPKIKTGVLKNYRNFLFHIGWTESSGALTKEGLDALHAGALYGANSRPFIDVIAKAVLVAGKHLILFNAINEFQDTSGSIDDEQAWLQALEEFLEAKGLLKRNPARGLAAVAGSARQFLKAEKQLWRNLDLIIPRGARVFHPRRGFIFDWARITGLLQDSG